MEEATDYRFGPVLTPETESTDNERTLETLATEPPVQDDILAAAAPLDQAKAQLRGEFRVRRDALSDKERNAAARRIAERLMQHPDVHRSKTVLLYANYASEVPTDELAKELMRRGKAVAYPKITSVAGLMTLWRIRHLDALIPHKHGIRAPDVTRASPIEPITVECVIFPGVAFSKGLARLGQGGGYYDRLASKLADNCTRIGVCFETQLADALPQDEHDSRMHWVVTEATVYPFVPDPPVIAPTISPGSAAVGVGATGAAAEGSTTSEPSAKPPPHASDDGQVPNLA